MTSKLLYLLKSYEVSFSYIAAKPFSALFVSCKKLLNVRSGIFVSSNKGNKKNCAYIALSLSKRWNLVIVRLSAWRGSDSPEDETTSTMNLWNQFIYLTLDQLFNTFKLTIRFSFFVKNRLLLSVFVVLITNIQSRIAEKKNKQLCWKCVTSHSQESPLILLHIKVEV